MAKDELPERHGADRPEREARDRGPRRRSRRSDEALFSTGDGLEFVTCVRARRRSPSKRASRGTTQPQECHEETVHRANAHADASAAAIASTSAVALASRRRSRARRADGPREREVDLAGAEHETRRRRPSRSPASSGDDVEQVRLAEEGLRRAASRRRRRRSAGTRRRRTLRRGVALTCRESLHLRSPAGLGATTAR